MKRVYTPEEAQDHPQALAKRVKMLEHLVQVLLNRTCSDGKEEAGQPASDAPDPQPDEDAQGG